MSDDRAAGDLREISDAIDRIRTYVSGHDRTSFLADRKAADAVAMNLLVIGEAVRRLDHAMLSAELDIPWLRIIAMRNRIAHGYSSLHFDVIWTIVSTELDPLLAAIVRIATRLK